jgi:transmembrane sensor
MDSERLARYLAGEASTAERSAIEAWAAANPANRAELSRLGIAWAATPPAGTWEVDAAWRSVSGRLDRPSSDIQVFPVRRIGAARWLAAAAVLMVAGGGFWYLGRDRATEYATAVGEPRQVSLPDGSLVTLAPASRLVVAASYGRPARSLRLTGRAWFVVEHDAERPFRVTTPAGVVEDLGTEFEVTAIGEGLQVAVAKGAVAIHRAEAATVTLVAGDLATVARSGEPTVTHAIEVDRISSWRSGVLDFQDRPLAEVAAELERWYDVKFTLAEPAASRRFNGPMPTDRLDQVVSILATAFQDLTVIRSGSTITIAAKSP